MEDELTIKKELLRSYFAQTCGMHESPMMALARALRREGYQSLTNSQSKTFEEAINAVYAKIERGEKA